MSSVRFQLLNKVFAVRLPVLIQGLGQVGATYAHVGVRAGADGGQHKSGLMACERGRGNFLYQQ